MKERSGRIEKKIAKDPIFGTTLWQLTDYEAHHIHPYYDIDSWSPDGKKIVFSAAYDKDVAFSDPYMYTPDQGNLLTYDTETDKIEWLADGLGFNSHTGVFPFWTPDGKCIVCGESVKTAAADRSIKIFDAASHKLVKQVDGLHPRQMSPDGTRILCQSDIGVVLYDFATGNQRVLYSFTQIISHLPVYDGSYAEQAVVANLKWNHDGTRFLFRFSFKPGEYMKSLYVGEADGSKLTRLDGPTLKFHHPSWVPRENRILFGDWDANGEPHIFHIDFDGKNCNQISKRHLHGHPIYNPAGTQIITDNYKGEEYGRSILLYDLKSDTVRQIASFTVNFVRSNAHPVWNHDGTQILYHSDHTGHSQLYIIPLAEL
ncbi:MAG: hypothetical protein LBU32_15255 [Clostridiales bacterium]|jgi:Tol biopolymer transport system component|nr:hypothetical protein [Clostridiales bacterium]